MNDVTRLLSHVKAGDPTRAEELLPLVYDELRRLAAHKLAHEKPGQTLQATALVHEAYLRLIDGHPDLECADRQHFFALVAGAMRRILVDHARRKRADIRGGGWQRFELAESDLISHATPAELVALDDALMCLAAEDAAAAELVNLRMFAGLSVGDAARVLGIPRATAYRHWQYARAWLRAELRT